MEHCPLDWLMCRILSVTRQHRYNEASLSRGSVVECCIQKCVFYFSNVLELLLNYVRGPCILAFLSGLGRLIARLPPLDPGRLIKHDPLDWLMCRMLSVTLQHHYNRAPLSRDPVIEESSYRGTQLSRRPVVECCIQKCVLQIELAKRRDDCRLDERQK
jgi:hypothetical protein